MRVCGKATYAEGRVDEACHALGLGDLVEGVEVGGVERHDPEVFCNSGGGDGFGKGSHASCD